MKGKKPKKMMMGMTPGPSPMMAPSERKGPPMKGKKKGMKK